MIGLIDMTGQRFGHVVALRRDGGDAHGRAAWRCQCDRGRTAIIVGHQLRRGRTRSCGCLTFGAPLHRADINAAVFASRTVETPGGCLVWVARPNPDGYGVFYVRGQQLLAHRVAWALVHGSTPAEMQVCHTCDSRLCVRPDHLFLGTNADNQRDAVAKGRHRAPPNQGVDNANAKITEDDVREIRALRSAGTPRREVAARFGIGTYRVTDITSGRSWSHVGTAPSGGL